jgi:23S rRNA (uridine2552-2'-O)-methyltransferase
MAVAFALEHLEPGGTFCSKVFQGGATANVLDTLKHSFKTVKHIKPPSSRVGSPEIFVIATGFRP